MIVVKRKPIHYDHEVTYYVPVFQKDFNEEGELLHHPTFTYELSQATQDEQMAWSFEPAYVLELRGHIDFITKPLIIKEEDDENK